jgi:hypothetical protein
MTPEHPPKVPRHKMGLSTPVQRYHGQVSGGLAAPIPTPASWLLSPSHMVLSPSVPQQPIPVPVTGTASHRLDLEQSTMDLEQLTVGPEQPIVDLDQYHWLFAKGKGEVMAAINVGLTRFQSTTDSFWHTCELHTIRMTGCINYLFDIAWYLEVCPKDLAKGVQALRR